MQIQGLKISEKAEKNGLAIDYDVQRLKAFTQTLPFELTAAQKRVTNEICHDLKKSATYAATAAREMSVAAKQLWLLSHCTPL